MRGSSDARRRECALPPVKRGNIARHAVSTIHRAEPRGNGAAACRRAVKMPYLASFLASQAFMKAISLSCALMIASASFRISGSLPYCSSTRAMAIAPS